MTRGALAPTDRRVRSANDSMCDGACLAARAPTKGRAKAAYGELQGAACPGPSRAQLRRPFPDLNAGLTSVACGRRPGGESHATSLKRPAHTLGRRETAGPAKGCFCDNPYGFQSIKNRHGMPYRAVHQGVIGERGKRNKCGFNEFH